METSLHSGTKLVAIKRYLTHTERDRYLLKAGHDPDDKFYGACVKDCLQNVVEERKLEKEFDLLEKQQKVLVNKINSEQHLLKLKWKKLNSESNTDIGDVGEDRNPQLTGSVFRPNGEKRETTDQKLTHSITKLKDEAKKLTQSILEIHQMRSGDSRSQKERAKVIITTINPETNKEEEVDSNKFFLLERRKLEKMVAEISSEAERVSENKHKQQEHKKHPYLRAHENDYQWDISTGSARRESRCHQTVKALGCNSSVSNETKSSPTEPRYMQATKCKHRTRANCAACEYRFKQESDARISGSRSKNHSNGLVAPDCRLMSASGVILRDYSLSTISPSSSSECGQNFQQNLSASMQRLNDSRKSLANVMASHSSLKTKKKSSIGKHSYSIQKVASINKTKFSSPEPEEKPENKREDDLRKTVLRKLTPSPQKGSIDSVESEVVLSIETHHDHLPYEKRFHSASKVHFPKPNMLVTEYEDDDDDDDDLDDIEKSKVDKWKKRCTSASALKHRAELETQKSFSRVHDFLKDISDNGICRRPVKEAFVEKANQKGHARQQFKISEDMEKLKDCRYLRFYTPRKERADVQPPDPMELANEVFKK